MEIALPVQPAVKSNFLNHGPLFTRRIATIQDAVIRLNPTAMLNNLRNVGRVVVLISINSNNVPDFPSGAHFFFYATALAQPARSSRSTHSAPMTDT
jgi:hypothetical protein